MPHNQYTHTRRSVVNAARPYDIPAKHMIERLRQAVIGVSAAMSTPFWLRDRRLKDLIDGQAPAAVRADDPTAAIRFAYGALRILGRTPLLPYRNTCLYRSIAECLTLTRLGIPCRLRIGVQRDGPACDAIEAHAWVERGGGTTMEPPYVPLEPHG